MKQFQGLTICNISKQVQKTNIIAIMINYSHFYYDSKNLFLRICYKITKNIFLTRYNKLK